MGTGPATKGSLTSDRVSRSVTTPLIQLEVRRPTPVPGVETFKILQEILSDRGEF